MWERCLMRGFIAVVGLGLLGMVTSAASRRPTALSVAERGSAQALARRLANPMEADMVSIVAGPAPTATLAPAVTASSAVTPVPAPGPTLSPAPRASVQAAAPAVPAPPPPAADPPPAPLSRAAQAVETALSELGKPYRYGALGPGTFDCSGLTKFAYGAAGIDLPHSAAAQYRSGPRVDRSQLQPGDLIFWRGLGHVAMYIGGGRMVHAPETGDVVRVASIDQGAYLGAVRPGG